MRRFRNIARIFLGIVLGGYLALLALLHFDPLQQRLTAWGAKALAEQLQTEVSIGEIEVGLFNKVLLRDVCIKDQQKDTLLKAQALSAKIQLAPLFDGMVSLRTISLIDADIKLYQIAKNKPANYQFLLEAFKSKDTKEPSKLDLRINSLILRRCRLSYDKRYLPATPGKFNMAHLRLSSVDANASLKALTKDSVNMRLRFLSFKEQSGVQLRTLKMKLSANRHTAIVEDFLLRLAQSSLMQNHVVLNYDLSDFLGTLSVAGHLQGARLATSDFSPFVPQLKRMPHSLNLSTAYRYENRRLLLTNFSLLEETGKLALKADASVRFLPNRIPWVSLPSVELKVDTDVADEVTKVFAGKGLSKEVLALKRVQLKGRGHYDAEGRSTIRAAIATAVGYIDIDALMKDRKVSGVVIGKGVNLSALLSNETLPSNANFRLKVNHLSQQQQGVSGEAHLALASADFKSYVYHDLDVKMQAQGNQLQLVAHSSDPNLNFIARGQGTLVGQTLKNMRGALDVRRVVPAVMGWTNRYGHAAFAFQTEAQIASASLKEPFGTLDLRNFSMAEGEDVYHLQKLHLSLAPQGKEQRLTLQSDFAESEIEGQLSLPRLKAAVLGLVEEILPGVLSRKVVPKTYARNDNWHISLKVLRDDFFQKMLKLPLHLDGPLSMKGNLSTGEQPTALLIEGAGLSYNGNHLQSPRFTIDGQGLKYRLKGQSQVQFKGTDVQLSLNAETDSGRLNTKLSWDDVAVHRYAGSLSAQTYSERRADGLRHTITALQPSQLRVRDTLWTVEGGRFSLIGKSFRVNRFRIAYKDHSLSLHGGVSPDSGDSLCAELQKMDLDYVLSLVNFKTLHFEGLATGNAVLTLADGQPMVKADIEVDSLYMNEGLLGHTVLKGGFDGQTKRILLDADITEGSVAHATVKGFVSPANKTLDLAIENQNLRANFLQRYVSGIVSNLDARSTGSFRVAGSFQDIALSGTQDFIGSAFVNSLGVDYQVSEGHADVTPNRFSFTNVVVKDGKGGQGNLTGVVNHDYLRDMRYTFEADVKNLYVYHQPDLPDVPYFSQAYGTGHVSMSGRPGAFSADINLRPEQRSYITYKADATDGGATVPFLTFRDRDTLSQAQALSSDSLLDTLLFAHKLPVPSKAQTATTDIHLNFHIDANPDAELRVIMDQRAGDNIVLRGEGGLHATYYNKGAFNVYGTYNVLNGTYRMTIQDFIKKDFAFTGGALTFAGEPFQAGLDLKAVYTVPSASLSGLYTGVGLSENNVKVNCLLNITGRASAPQVTFDLDLPTADTEVKQLVRNVINTQNDMNMQVLYLLGFGRFYSYNATTVVAGAGQSQSMVAMKSLLSSTLTNQLNDILSSAMGSSNWSFGTNITTGDIGWSDVEVEGVLRGSLFNNRLQLNGNFGYRDRALSTRTSNFVGDFDIRYLLTPRGGISLKAYSTTNERYFTRSSLTTQGLGVMFRKDFTDLRDFFRRKRKAGAKESKLSK